MSGYATSTRDYLRRERARRRIIWKKAVQMAQVCKLPLASDHLFYRTPPLQTTRRERRSRTPHRVPRCQAIIAQSRRNANHATPATIDLVISTLRVRALHKATGAPLIPATQLRRYCTRRILIPSQARRSAVNRISTRRAQSATTACTCARRSPHSIRRY